MYLIYVFQKENGRRAFKCQLCPTINNCIKEIQQHIAVVHEGKKQYACEICHKEFGYLRYKKKHQKSGKCPSKPKMPINVDNKNVPYLKFMVIQPHFSKIQKYR